LQQAASQPDFCSTLGGNPPVCAQVYGTHASQPGEACTQDNDCALAPNGGAICVDQIVADGGASPGKVCVQTLPGGAGASPCIGASGVVSIESWSGGAWPPLGYLCDPTTTVCDPNHTCTLLSAVGAACATDAQCVPSAYCDFSTMQCAARATAGTSCATAECDPTSYCDTSTKTCTPKLAAGTPCPADTQECISGACGQGKCLGGNLGLDVLCGT
jgi:hypothetical protein